MAMSYQSTPPPTPCHGFKKDPGGGFFWWACPQMETRHKPPACVDRTSCVLLVSLLFHLRFVITLMHWY